MDGILETYKQIVDRAVFLGLLSEENKSFYLSAIDDPPTCSNRSTSISHPTRIGKSAQSFSRPEDWQHIEGHIEHNQIHNTCTELNETVCNSTVGDRLSTSGARSVENYSILDIKNLPDVKKLSTDSESDISTFLKQACMVASTNHIIHPSLTVKKKPKKNEIVDFRVPIYVDLKKKKISTRPKFKRKRRTETRSQDATKSKITLENDNTKTNNMSKIEFKTLSNGLQSESYSRKLDRPDMGSLQCGTCRESLQNGTCIESLQNCVYVESFPNADYSEKNETDERNIHRIFSPRNFRNNLNDLRVHEMARGLEKRKIQHLCTLRALEKIESTEGRFMAEKRSNDIKFTRKHAVPDRRKAKNTETEFEDLRKWDPTKLSGTHIDLDYLKIRDRSSLNNHSFESGKECNTSAKQRLSVISNDATVKEATMTDNKAQEDADKLLKVNIICQFFQNESSITSPSIERQSDSSYIDTDVQVERPVQVERIEPEPSLNHQEIPSNVDTDVQTEKASQIECVEPSRNILDEHTHLGPKKKTNRKQATRFLSKIFSRLKSSAKDKP